MDKEIVDRLLEGAERIARIETMIEQLSKRPDHVADIAKIKQNLRAVNWIGSIAGVSAIGGLISRLLNKFPF